MAPTETAPLASARVLEYIVGTAFPRCRLVYVTPAMDLNPSFYVGETPVAAYTFHMKILTTALLLALLTSVCLSEEMPVGWAKPPAKLTGQEFRRKDPNHFLIVTGDFNGDGVQDTALLPVNQHTQKLGFFICLTTATGCDWHRLEVMDIAFLDLMGIGKVKPGQYETACGKGYWDCRKDEPKILSTKRDAVEFFKDESASSVYVYNAGKRAFISVATSD